jgi:hypothetical protein
LGGSLLEFICERGVPHLYYAAFADDVVPIEPILTEVMSVNDKGVFSNYWLRKELAKTTFGDQLPGKTSPLPDADVV